MTCIRNSISINIHLFTLSIEGFPCGSVVKNSPANVGDVGSIPGSGRSPGEGNGYPIQSCLGNLMDREEAWRATYSPWSQSQTQLSNSHTSTYLAHGRRSTRHWGYRNEVGRIFAIEGHSIMNIDKQTIRA